MIRVFLGWDAEEMLAWNVAAHSIRRHTPGVSIEAVGMTTGRGRQLYRRPTKYLDKGYWDVLSDAPMSTAHAIARFLVPALCGYRGWAVFADGDVLARRSLAELEDWMDPRYAVCVVQHDFRPRESEKMDGQTQTVYARKNWSSVMLLHCAHPANRALTVDLVNEVPGRDLHRFCWLSDDLIGALPPEWNHLVGHSTHPDPALVHFTSGLPNMAGYEHVEFADEWHEQARQCGYHLSRAVGA